VTTAAHQPAPARRETPAGDWWRAYAPFALVGLAALVVRIVYLLEIAGTDAFRVYLGDARAYDLWARQIVAGDWVGQGVFYQAPLYPYFLAVVYAVLGSAPIAVKLVQMLLGSTACVLLALAGREAFGRRVGLVAGWLWAIYPPAFFFDGIIQKASLTGFLFALLLYLLARYTHRAAAAGRPPRLLGWGAGAVLGLMALTRENALILAPVVLAWTLLMPAGRFRRAHLAAVAFLFAGLASALLPVAVRNRVVGGEFQLTTAQFGPNLYLGNNPETDGTYQPLRPGRGDPRYERYDATWLAEQALGRHLSPAQVSGYWTGRVVAYARAQPLDWLTLQARKLLLMFHTIEIGDTEDIYTYAESAPLLRWLLAVFHMGVLLPLAAMGLALAWPRRRDVGWLYALLAAYTLGALASVIYARYRYPLVPLLALFAAFALVEVHDRLRAPGGRPAPRERGRWAAILALGALAAVAVNWPIDRPESYRVSTHANIANELITRKEYDRAFAHLQTALALAPDYPNAHHLMGVALAELGRPDEAERHYRAAIAGDPATALPYYCLGTLLAEQQRWDEAIEQYRLALERDPTYGSTYGNLAIALAQRGNYTEAIALLERGLEYEPDSPELIFDYGLALRRAGRPDDARRAFERLLARQPDYMPALHNLVSLDLEAGAPEQARARLAEIARAHPEDQSARVRLAWLLVSHPEARVRDGQRGLALARDLSADGRRREPPLLDLLAAALAETGDSGRAAQVAREAARIAAEAGAVDLAAQIEARAALYERGQPYRATTW
jgi:tetratricopeptide (TPR) repeat protein/4-amino-4-deoxy-L-arabinose transferase-like glycosyltransferase